MDFARGKPNPAGFVALLYLPIHAPARFVTGRPKKRLNRKQKRAEMWM
jgi:hypothetical protein